MKNQLKQIKEFNSKTVNIETAFELCVLTGIHIRFNVDGKDRTYNLDNFKRDYKIKDVVNEDRNIGISVFSDNPKMTQYRIFKAGNLVAFHTIKKGDTIFDWSKANPEVSYIDAISFEEKDRDVLHLPHHQIIYVQKLIDLGFYVVDTKNKSIINKIKNYFK